MVAFTITPSRAAARLNSGVRGVMQRISLAIFALIAFFTLSACGSDKLSGGPLEAIGETPVRYIICSVGDQNCFVAARFNDLDSCNNHKNLSEMLCDRLSEPGTVTCKKDMREQLAVSYCTK